MTKFFDAAMRRAGSLMRSGKLQEATRAIQDGIAGGALRDTAPREGSGPTIDITPNRQKADRARPQPGKRAAKPEASPTQGGLAGGGMEAVSQLMKKFGAGKFASPLSSSLLGQGHVGTSVPVPAGAEFLSLTHSGPSGSRDYRLYVPAAKPHGKLPLVVMLHGCTQNPEDFAAGTGMNRLAEEFGVLVAYPEQTRAYNVQGCWNWFEARDQRRGSGEPAILAGMVADIVAAHGADPERIFVAGLSAGGAMAAILAETYPELFAAAGVHSGLPHGAAQDVSSALRVMRQGATAAVNAKPVPDGSRYPRIIVFHGTRDTTVHPSNGAAVAEAVRTRGVAGLPKVKQGEAGGRRYRRDCLLDREGRIALEHWEIEGLGHAWSGGSTAGSYADPAGPDASREMLRFFLRA